MAANITTDQRVLENQALVWANEAALTALSVIIILMPMGFALLEVGSVRSKNATSILFKNFVGMREFLVLHWNLPQCACDYVYSCLLLSSLVNYNIYSKNCLIRLTKRRQCLFLQTTVAQFIMHALGGHILCQFCSCALRVYAF